MLPIATTELAARSFGAFVQAGVQNIGKSIDMTTQIQMVLWWKRKHKT